MAKFTPRTIQNLSNQNTAVAQINYNFETLQTLIDTLLSRDGQTPNTMQSILDMNGNRVLNLPVPVSAQEPARHGDIQQYVDQAEDWAGIAEGFAEDAEESASNAAASESEVDADLKEFQSEYLGAFPTAPVFDKNGSPIKDGAFYYNSTNGTIAVYARRDVLVGEDSVKYNVTENVVADEWVTLPVYDFYDLQDVDLTEAAAGDYLIWSGTTVLPVTLTADVVPQSNEIYNGTSVQDALDDVINRTSLGIYDVYVYAQGLPGGSEELVRMVASRPFRLPVSGGQSVAKARVAPDTTSVTFSIKKNGLEVGTVAFAADSANGVFTVAGDVDFVVGDVLSIAAPASLDVAFRDLSITLACVR